MIGNCVKKSCMQLKSTTRTYRPVYQTLFPNCYFSGNLSLMATQFDNLEHCLPKYVSFDIQMASIWIDKGFLSIWKSLNQQTTNIGYVCFYAVYHLHILFAVHNSKLNKLDFEWQNIQDFKCGHLTNKCFTKFSNPRNKKHVHNSVHNTEKCMSLCNTKNSKFVLDFQTSYSSDFIQLWEKFAAQNTRLTTLIGRSIGDNFENNGKVLTDSSLNALLNSGHKHKCVHPRRVQKNSNICEINSDNLHTNLTLNHGFIQRKINVCLLPFSIKQGGDPGGGQHVHLFEITSTTRQNTIHNCVRSSLIYMFSFICVLAYENLRRNENIKRTKEISEKFFSQLLKKPSIDKIHKDRRILQALLELITIKVCQHITAYPVSRLSLNNILDKERSGSLSESRMNNELMRLSTLSNFPVNGMSLIRLAENGFFFEGNGDELVCYSCGIRLKGWRTDSIPADIHQKYSPNCLHILERKSDPADLPGSINSIATDGRTEHSHAEVSNGDITCEQIMCTDARHEDSFNSLLISTSQNDARLSNNCASTSPSQLSKRSTSNMTNHVSSSTSVMGGQSEDHQYPRSNSSVNYFADGYRLSDSGHRSQHTLSCNPCSDFISSNMPRPSIGSINGRTPTRTSFLERQLSIDGETNFSHNFNNLSLMSDDQRQRFRDNSHYQDTELYLPSPPIIQRLPNTFDHNIPNTCSDHKLSTDSVAHRAARPSPMKYPNYESLQSRKDSYFDWPANRRSLHPYDLSECGLFFTHFEDCVRCFQCGIGLRNWEEDDNPWVEHARWSVKCQYLIRRKGKEFIDSVVKLLGLETDEAIAQSISPQLNVAEFTTTRTNPLEHKAAIYVLSEGIFDKNEMVQECMNSLLETYNWHSITIELLVTSILEKNETSPSESSSGQDIATDRVNTSWNGVINTDRNGLIPIDKPETTLPTKDFKPIDNDIERKSKADDDPGTLQKENEELEDLYTCKICLDEKVGVTFLPCGHLVTCKSCSPKLRKCPLCRKFIRSTITTRI